MTAFFLGQRLLLLLLLLLLCKMAAVTNELHDAPWRGVTKVLEKTSKYGSSM